MRSTLFFVFIIFQTFFISCKGQIKKIETKNEAGQGLKFEILRKMEDDSTRIAIYKPQIITIQNNYKSILRLDAFSYSKDGDPIFGEGGSITFWGDEKVVFDKEKRMNINPQTIKKITYYISYFVKVNNDLINQIIDISSAEKNGSEYPLYNVMDTGKFNILIPRKDFSKSYTILHCQTKEDKGLRSIKVLNRN